MQSRLRLVWFVARRELRDQLRDWRVVFPLTILTLGFPLIMNEVARATINFVNQYGANLVIDSLVPFSILIIGFFPNTISLVVALESFVGEKERGTIEPLLSSPLEDWQMYLGKLLIGIFTPLCASYTSITLYLLMVTHLRVMIPSWQIILQLYMLTTAHAILMVSGAIIISVQSTSVKAANLLASFIIIPVAFLLQGESVLLFWGNGKVLWLAVVGVLILAALLIRVGIAHFQREYLLGREIDTLNFLLIWKSFWRSLMDGAHSLGEWYSQAVFPATRRLAVPMLLMVAIAIAGGSLGYGWVNSSAPALLKNLSPSDMSKMAHQVQDSPRLAQLGVSLNVPALFIHNVQAVAFMLVAGLVSFSVLGILFYIVNVGLIGGVLSLFAMLGISPITLFVAGLLPHGMFEIPALMLGGAAVLRIGVALVTPQVGKSMGEVLIELLADWAKVFIGLIIPLLAVAAVIETYVTPVILSTIFKR
ncbi:MAG TPA: stage II sporulation protein M [Anaerolineales bacterium]|nr:stage II sporulation protein M [Anaerolineales bacterium]